MNKLIIPILIVIFSISCATTNEYIKPDFNYKKYNRIAILPLSDYYTVPGSGKQVADMVSMKMLISNLRIIDRSETEAILKEQEIGLSGIIDRDTAPKVGNILGVQAFITGSISMWKSSPVNIQIIKGSPPAYVDVANVAITLKLIDAETGEILWAASAEGRKSGLNQESTAASKAVDHLVKTLLTHF